MFYIARLTHNNGNHWQKPSGQKYKSPNTDSAFEAQYKFGFEEWFQCERHELNGYQYAYIENLEAHHCKNEILLHTIRHNDDNQRSVRKLVGILRKSDYYTDWNDIRLQDIAAKLYAGMKEDLSNVLSQEQLKPAVYQLRLHRDFVPGSNGKPLFNLRYRKEDFEYIFPKQFDSMGITNNRRFVIEKIDQNAFQAYPESVQQQLLTLGLK